MWWICVLRWRCWRPGVGCGPASGGRWMRGQGRHRGDEWADRIGARRAIRYDLSYDPARGRWYLDASWKTTPPPAASLEELRGAPMLGVDLNAGHLAACVLDSSGNPVGEAVSIE